MATSAMNTIKSTLLGPQRRLAAIKRTHCHLAVPDIEVHRPSSFPTQCLVEIEEFLERLRSPNKTAQVGWLSRAVRRFC
jgi:hypothetical protein